MPTNKWRTCTYIYIYIYVGQELYKPLMYQQENMHGV